jgi:hypothetical protein
MGKCSGQSTVLEKAIKVLKSDSNDGEKAMKFFNSRVTNSTDGGFQIYPCDCGPSTKHR